MTQQKQKLNLIEEVRHLIKAVNKLIKQYIKLKNEFDFIKQFVETEDGTFTFPDGERIGGCAIRKQDDVGG